MELLIKRGVVIAQLEEINLLKPAMLLLGFCGVNGLGDVTITAGIDGNHLADSRHYMGRAIDLRLPSEDKDINQQAIDYLRKQLPGWTIILEGDHIHAHLNPTA